MSLGMQPPPKVDLGADEVARHETSFQSYKKNFNEQLELHEARFKSA